MSVDRLQRLRRHADHRSRIHVLRFRDFVYGGLGGNAPRGPVPPECKHPATHRRWLGRCSHRAEARVAAHSARSRRMSAAENEQLVRRYFERVDADFYTEDAELHDMSQPEPLKGCGDPRLSADVPRGSLPDGRLPGKPRLRRRPEQRRSGPSVAATRAADGRSSHTAGGRVLRRRPLRPTPRGPPPPSRRSARPPPSFRSPSRVEGRQLAVGARALLQDLEGVLHLGAAAQLVHHVSR
jgi:hypothetical protein